MKNYIYTLSDPISNEVRYVGKSIDPLVRCRKHISEAKNSKSNNHRINWIKSLLNKGLIPKMDIIDEINNEWEWLEEYWVSQFITWGFKLVNSTNGSENPPSFKGRKLTIEHKEKMLIGTKKFFLELKDGLPIEWKQNISKAHKANGFLPTKAIESNLVKVNQYNLTGEFIKKWSSITEAANSLNLKNISGIREVCLGKRFKAGNFRWSYNNKKLFNFVFKPKGSKGISKQAIQKAKEANEVKVNQYSLTGEFIKTWSSITEAALQLNIKSSSGITEACRNNKFMCGNFRWAYINETLKPYKLSIGKSVRQLDLDGNLITIWNSTSEIKNKLGFNSNCIAKACSGSLKTYKKYKWIWEEIKNIS